ncbi:pilin [Acinetobacter cumulans]|uniref:Pilin n=1 Tax=Acinetobacter cumulans TaxID=2136182 RepID=A0ABX9U851_9GAMM|nr:MULTISPECIES: pilin [Acinetobacter]RLL48647.1 pilin [Acinetobacter cumulans]
MKTYEIGFTLLELVIVVAVISILAALSVYNYQNYIVKAQVNSILAELKGGKLQYELILNSASVFGVRSFTVENVFLNKKSNFCLYKVYEPIDGVSAPAFECKILGKASSALSDRVIYFDRDLNGNWKCRYSLDFIPKFKQEACL